MERTLVICPSEHGHYGTYVKYLLDYMAEAGLDPQQLALVVPKGFAHKRADVVAQSRTVGVTLHYYTPWALEHPRLRTVAGPLGDWREALSVARKMNAERVVFLNFDALAQICLPWTHNVPFRVSGILYRPFPHYRVFPATRLSTALELKRVRQELVLTQACRNPQLEALYWLDPHAAKYMNTRTTPRNVWLPDPVEREQPSAPDLERVRRNLGVPPNGRLWLVFGADIVRKGTREILRALPSGECARDVTLAFVGPIYQGQAQSLFDAVAEARPRFAGNIVVHPEFVPENEVACYFHAASLVFTLYHHHMGSSGALVRAAAAGTPVLSTEFGLLGYLTQTRKLGFTCNVKHEVALRNALRQAAQGVFSRAFDPTSARQFALEHDKSTFARKLLLGPTQPPTRDFEPPNPKALGKLGHA